MCLQLAECIIKTKLLLSKLVSGCYCSQTQYRTELTKSDFKLITESSQGSRDHQVSKRIKIQLLIKRVLINQKYLFTFIKLVLSQSVICLLTCFSHASLCFLILHASPVLSRTFCALQHAISWSTSPGQAGLVVSSKSSQLIERPHWPIGSLVVQGNSQGS